MNIEEKAKEILRSKLTDIYLESYLKGSPLTYNACLEAVKEAINYTHSCKSDSEQLVCDKKCEWTRYPKDGIWYDGCVKCGKEVAN